MSQEKSPTSEPINKEGQKKLSMGDIRKMPKKDLITQLNINKNLYIVSKNNFKLNKEQKIPTFSLTYLKRERARILMQLDYLEKKNM